LSSEEVDLSTVRGVTSVVKRAWPSSFLKVALTVSALARALDLFLGHGRWSDRERR
jgi:hypothetical protein